MAADDSELCTSIHYKPDVRPSILLAFGLGLQPAILFVAGIVLTAAIVVHAGGGTEAFLSWAVFTLVGISGMSTVLQAIRLSRIGRTLVNTSGAGSLRNRSRLRAMPHSTSSRQGGRPGGFSYSLGRFGDASADRLRAGLEGGQFPEPRPAEGSLREAVVRDDAIYEDQASGQREDRPGLAVYPRACGGTFRVRKRVIENMGLSPRMRGNLVAMILKVSRPGSIPAHAGEPPMIAVHNYQLFGHYSS